MKLRESKKKGWADDRSQSHTWFEAALRRPHGRSDVGNINIHHNPAGKKRLSRTTTRWDTQNSSLRVRSWLRSLQPGDVVQLVPRAHFRCWVNIVLEASIEIEYEARAAHGPQQAAVVPSDGRVYQTLGEGRQIRVLVVKPGTPEANIEAKFKYVDLAEPVETRRHFQALSYFWGDSSERVPISITAGDIVGTVGISPTLDRAIRRLRSPDEPLPIWIDAVCINQDDLQERARQVAMMGYIYARSEMVHIWIDDHVLALDEALRLIRDIYNCNHRICAGGEQCTCSGTRHSLSADMLDEITQTKEWHSIGFVREVFAQHTKLSSFGSSATEAAGGGSSLHLSYFMQTFFHHPWFQRVWVIQEAALSRSAVVYSTGESIPWDELLAVNDIISSPEYAAESRWSVQTRDAMPAIWNALGRLHGRHEDGELLPILQVFLKALDLKATDPRDKLFALLAFGRETRAADKIPPLLRPDYNKPLPNVMADLTRWWILEYGSLDILSLVHAQPARAWRRTLCDRDPRVDTAEVVAPSWALGAHGHSQLSQMTLIEHLSRLEGSPFASTTKTPAEENKASSLIHLSSNVNSLELALSGRRIGEITNIGHPPRKLVPLRAPNTSSFDTTALTLPAIYHSMFDPSALSGVWLLQGVNYREPPPDRASLQGILDDHVHAHFGYVPATYQLTLHPAASKARAVGGVGDADDVPAEDDDAAGYGYDSFGSGEDSDDDSGLSGSLRPFSSYIKADLPACIEPCFFFFADAQNRNHRYGLCPWTAREGDVVVTLKGGRVPFLLRRASEAKPEESEGERWQFVGECFVEGMLGCSDNISSEGDGWMEGERLFVLV